MDYPLKWLCDNWLSLFEESKKIRQERFGQYAEECDRFYDTAHNGVWKDMDRKASGFINSPETPRPTFRMTINRVFEAVALFSPAMLQRYPQVTVTPVEFPYISPDMLGLPPKSPEYMAIKQQQAGDKTVKDVTSKMMAHYLNWVQVETGKKNHARRSISGALVTGLGVLFNELYAPPGSSIRYPRSRHISWKQLLKDPDAQFAEDVQWIAIEWTHPVNKVEERFGLPPDTIKGQLQSIQSQQSGRGRKDVKKNTDTGSYDLLKYYELYSKNGAGDRLKKSGKAAPYDLSGLGDYVRLFFAPNVPFPLNLHPSVADPEQILAAVEWPVPFWMDDADGRGWPTTELSYYDKDSCIWPVSLFKPVIGPMQFVNWVMSFMADKVAGNAHDILAVQKAAAKDLRDQLMSQNGPIKLVELADIQGQKINDVISRLQRGEPDVEIFKMAAEMMEIIDKGTGLTELVYGLTGSQMRSAAEAGLKNDRISVRPDDMAEKTDDWYSEAAMKEIAIAAALLERADIEPVLGPIASDLFEVQVMQASPEAIMRDYSYRVAAGSARKPNKSMILQGLNEFGRVAGPVMQELAVAGFTQPWNAYAMDVAQALDLKDPERYLVNIPAPEGPQGPSPEEQQLANDQEQHDQEMLQSDERHDQEMEFEREKMQLDLLGQRAKIDATKEQAKVKADAARTAARKKVTSNGSK